MVWGSFIPCMHGTDYFRLGINFWPKLWIGTDKGIENISIIFFEFFFHICGLIFKKKKKKIKYSKQHSTVLNDIGKKELNQSVANFISIDASKTVDLRTILFWCCVYFFFFFRHICNLRVIVECGIKLKIGDLLRNSCTEKHRFIVNGWRLLIFSKIFKNGKHNS